jgi:hypothetical protein
MSRFLRLCRFALGRWLIHAGVRAMPRGATRYLITDKLVDARFEIEAELREERG